MIWEPRFYRVAHTAAVAGVCVGDTPLESDEIVVVMIRPPQPIVAEIRVRGIVVLDQEK